MKTTTAFMWRSPNTEDEAEYNEVSEILMNKIEQQYDVEYYDPTEQ